MKQPRCSHIILGVLEDSSYYDILKPFADDPSTRSYLTLLESPALGPRIGSLGFQRTLNFSTMFTPHRLSTATLAYQPRNGKNQARYFSSSAISSAWLGPVLRNPYGLRVDKRLESEPRGYDFKKFEGSARCKRFYLRGGCENESCAFGHQLPPLNAWEYDVVWSLARKTSCDWGKRCDKRVIVRDLHFKSGANDRKQQGHVLSESPLGTWKQRASGF